MVVAAGSLVFFSPHSVHGSLPNRSDRPRRALVLTYQPAGHPMLKSGVVRNVVGEGAGRRWPVHV
jgi:ectoine hydroxylase-related dioxygenase (phytanoyl-CoA dioxygenase family)